MNGQECANMTAEEAWETAKKILFDYSNAEMNAIFGRGWTYKGVMDMTPQQAKEKIETWGPGKEIKAGDEVEVFNETGVVTICDYNLDAYFVYTQSGRFTIYPEACLKKTGRKVDIKDLMSRIGGYDE